MEIPENTPTKYPFLREGGEMGTLMRQFDWSTASIGMPNSWPIALKISLSTILSSASPMAILWGESLIQFYNDAFIPVMGNKHPQAFAGKGSDIYNLSWDVIKTVGFTNDYHIEQLGNGKYEFSYSAIRDEEGDIQGILIIGNESKKQLEESENRFRNLIQQAPIATCVFVGREMKIDIANEKMLAIWGKGNTVFGKPLVEALPELKGQPFLNLLDDIFTTGIAYEAKAMRADLVVDGILGTYYFDFTYKPIFNADGDVYGIMDMAVDVTEQVLIQQRNQEIQRELLSSFEESPVAIATISEENLTFRVVNPFYAELVGRTPKDLIDKPLLEALPEIAGQGFDDLLRNVIATDKAYVAREVRVELVRAGKLETIYVDLSYQPRREGNEKITGVLVVAIDVTEQIRTRKKIEESETKLRGIISAAPAGIGLFVGRDLIVENPNQTFIDIVGKGPDIVGKPLREVMPELLTEGQPFLKILDDVFTTGVEFQSPGSLVKIVKNGVMTNNYYNITYTPVFNAEGEVYAILDIAIDVTEQIKARQALEEAEAELRGAIELAGLATWKLDVKKNTFLYSPRFMEWLGFSENTKNLDDAYNPLPGEFRKSVPAAIESILLPYSSGFYDNEHPIVNRLTGQTRIIHAQGQVFYDASGNPAVLSGTAQDITLQRKLQLALETEVKVRTKELASAIEKLESANQELADSNTQLTHSNAELAQFAYIASHDLQEPLRKINTFSQLLEKSLGNNISDAASNYIAKIKNSSVRMTALVRDVLLYSQLVKENETFDKVDLNKILENIIEDYDLLIEQKEAVIKYDTLPVIDAIPLQMTQLFANLLGNALKFVRKDITPVITVSSTGLSENDLQTYTLSPNLKYIKIQITDNGIGLKPEYAEKIFNIFQRLHGKSEYEGTGIGLAMCKKIALNHQGDIYAQGNSENGATFSIILPIQQAK